MQLNSFDLAMIVVDVATEKFEPMWVVDDDRIHMLEQFFAPIDTIFNDTPHGELTVSVDDSDMSLNVVFSVDQLYAETAGDICPRLFDLANKVMLSSESGKLVVTCNLPGVWKKPAPRSRLLR